MCPGQKNICLTLFNLMDSSYSPCWILRSVQGIGVPGRRRHRNTQHAENAVDRS